MGTTKDNDKQAKKQFKTFEDLECWKACREVRRYTYKLLKKYPAEEKYGIIAQMKESGRSMTHNIAEGYGRYHYQENIPFCRHSRGSLYEHLDQYIASLDEGHISQEEYDNGRELIFIAIPVLNGYINYLTRAKADSSHI